MKSYSFNPSIKTFVIDALVEEAEHEGAFVYINYVWGEQEFDLFFPNSLRRFKNIYDRDVCVKISNSVTGVKELDENNKKTDVFRVNSIYICYDLIEVNPSNKSFLLGINTIRDLIASHKEAFLNYQLSNPSIKIDSNLNIRSPSLKEMQENATDKALSFDNNSPKFISLSNEARFKSSIRDNNRQIKKCSLIVGNGVSIPFGSDSWSDTVTNLMDYLKPYCIDSVDRVKGALSNSSYAVTSFVKTIMEDKIDPTKYNDALWSCIYRKFNKVIYKDNTLIKVISDAKYKYRSIPILTYNYDTFIEKQFSNDYSSKGTKLSYYCGNDYRANFVNSVIHLHGYLSYTMKNTKGIILTDIDYSQAYLSKTGSWIKDAHIFALKEYSCLFVGSSMSDLFQMSVINEVFNEEKDKGWCCYALMCLNGLSLKEKIHIIHFYRMRGIRLILADDYNLMPDKLRELLS